MVQRMVKTHFCGRSQQVKNPTMGTPWPPAREQTWIIQLGSNTFCISVFPTDSGVLAMNVISLIHLMLLSPPASPRGRQPYRYLPAGSWGTKCQGDKQDLPALWAGRGAAPHPGLPAEPSPHLNSVSHTLSGFWSPPARLTHRLKRRQKKKKKKKREGKRKEKKKSHPKPRCLCPLSEGVENCVGSCYPTHRPSWRWRGCHGTVEPAVWGVACPLCPGSWTVLI